MLYTAACLTCMTINCIYIFYKIYAMLFNIHTWFDTEAYCGFEAYLMTKYPQDSTAKADIRTEACICNKLAG
jgi:hypothetical protein